MKFNTKWFNYVSDKDKERLERELEASTFLLSILTKILEDDKESLYSNVSEADYRNTDFSHLQAHKNGKIDQLNKIILLLNGKNNA